MTLLIGEVIDVYPGEWTKMARVRIGGAITETSLGFLPEAEIGDTVLMEGGVAIAVDKKMETRMN